MTVYKPSADVIWPCWTGSSKHWLGNAAPVVAFRIVTLAPATGTRATELYTVPLGQRGRFRFCRLAPEATVMPLIRCGPLVNGESAWPIEAVFGPAPGARKRSS